MASIQAEMNKMFCIRQAEPTDAPEAVEVLRRSIMELCRADHQNDHETLAMWLGHRAREERFPAWLANKELSLVVAQAEDGIAGVGMLHLSGEIRLCYVRPGMASDWQFYTISKSKPDCGGSRGCPLTVHGMDACSMSGMGLSRQESH
jgi:hypothetical protein